MLALPPFAVFLTVEELRLESFIFLLPSIFVIFIAWIANKTSAKHPKATKILSFVFNIFILIFVQIIISLCIFLLSLVWGTSGNFENVKDYKKALRKIDWQEKIAHFPKEIPADAKNVQLYQDYGSWFGSEGITLKFAIDREYIQNELNKYKYVKIVDYNYDVSPSLYIYDDNGRIKTIGCKAYIINDREHEKLEGHYFPYAYGFCVNEKQNEIIYFYSDPD
ncbi:hypothetical protein IKQ21_09820 [bacterium]|nr:hypothetical protein [bacterium]